MQISALIVVFSAAAALAAPGPHNMGGGMPPPPAPPSPPTNHQGSTISCGGGSEPYCCDATGPNKADYTCNLLANGVQCNAVTICCSNQAGNNAAAAQTCLASIGGQSITFVN